MEDNPTAIRVVCIALVDTEGRVLLQKRRSDAHHGGLWEFPGGKVEAGESDESALCREIAEELGIEIAPGALSFAGESADGPPRDALHRQVVLVLYSCRCWSGDPRCLDAEAMAWCSPAQAAKLPVPPLDRPFIARLAAIVAGGSGDSS